MKPARSDFPWFDRLRTLLLAAGALAAVAAVILGWLAPASVLPAYRVAAFACLAPALGSIIFALLHRTTGGQWGNALVPYFAAGARLAPWIWLGVLGLLLFAPASAPAWPDYASRPMLALRGGFGVLLLFVIAWLLERRPPARSGALGPVGLIVLVFTLHVLANDWLMDLDSEWRSTAFPIVWMAGQAVAGLACAVLAALLAGRSPREAPVLPRALGLDWGNLLMASLIFWCYVAFAQFLIIWAGNLPGEISWYMHRLHGPWRWVPPALLALHFALPFAVLLSRACKRSAALLGFAAALLLTSQLLYVVWLILPVLPRAGRFDVVLPLVLLVAALALFFNRYLAGVQRRLKRS